MLAQRPYPRPDFDRSHCWLSLDGPWDFAPDPHDRGRAAGWEQPGCGSWSGTINVPFAWETPASGIGVQWLPIGWYRRRITRPAAWDRERTILHIGAAHYACQVWLIGRLVGEHTGGYLPFTCDLTDALDDGEGELVIRVEAPIDKRFIPHGKQRSLPPDDYDGCSFTPSSGIWQAVWLEARPATYIEGLRLRPSEGLSVIEVTVTVAGPRSAEAALTVEVTGQRVQPLACTGETTAAVTIPIDAPQLWAPDSPHLYDVVVRLESPDGSDQVRGYTGLRAIEAHAGHLFLNGQRLYVRGVLDQGYWPSAGYTAPDDQALRRDVELILAAGYNLARKHIKLEDPRWLYWADRLGLLVWEEPPCVGRYSPEACARFEGQLGPMVERDGNHPCIVLWGIYNEEWGLDFLTEQDVERQRAVERAYDKLAAAGHSRPIIDDSGWSHVKTDVLDWHYYDDDIARWARVTKSLADDATTPFGHQIGPNEWYETRLSVTGRDHSGLPLLNGEYGGGSTAAERGRHLRWQTQELRRHDAIDGYIYTEAFDVEHELCGIYTADRRMKPLGCNPAHINAATVIIFDLLPEQPKRDLVARREALEIPVRLSHHGARPLTGMLTWGWEADDAAEGMLPLEIKPYETTAPVNIWCELPAHYGAGRLHVRFIDRDGRRRAFGFLDVVMDEKAGDSRAARQATIRRNEVASMPDGNLEGVVSAVDADESAERNSR